MAKKNSGFDVDEFIEHVGQRLVVEFQHASKASTPGLKGAAREHPARMQLEKLLPPFASIGSGVVIDAYRSRSNQQDIVIYERDYCPTYSVNGTPEATYYPVETIMATGEVKSVVSKSVLMDALNKIKSVKDLRRLSKKERTEDGRYAAPYRHYGAGQRVEILSGEGYDQDKNYRDQIYTFLLCKKFSFSPRSILKTLIDFEEINGKNSMPSSIVSLEDGVIAGYRANDMSVQKSILTSDGLFFMAWKANAFGYLFFAIQRHLREGRSVPLDVLDHYLIPRNRDSPDGIYMEFRSRDPTSPSSGISGA